MKTQKTETNMWRIRNAVTTSLCTALVAGCLVLFAPETGMSQAEPVLAKGRPVAAAGNTVNLAPGTKVGIEGAPTVHLADRSVIVANSEDTPVPMRDIDRKPATPIHGSGGFILYPGNSSASEVIYTVPAGKRLVIEFIAAKMRLSWDGDCCAPDATVSITAGGVSFPLALMPQDGKFRLLGFSGITKIYAGAGTNVTLTMDLNSEESTAYQRASLKFAGYLEDL